MKRPNTRSNAETQGKVASIDALKIFASITFLNLFKFILCKPKKWCYQNFMFDGETKPEVWIFRLTISESFVNISENCVKFKGQARREWD